MTRQPTPQGISALLRKAGFERSVTSSTRIRGWHEWTEGFKTSKHYAGGVEVEWRPSSFRARDDHTAREAEMLQKYRDAIKAAGYRVEDGDSIRSMLIVTALPDGEEA